MRYLLDRFSNNRNGYHEKKYEHFDFDNIYEYHEKKTNHQELDYSKVNLLKTISINKVYKGKFKIYYHKSVKDHKCLSETVPYEIIDVAVKIIEQSDAADNENNEPEMLYYLRNEPDIIKQFGYHIDTKNKKCIMVLEWCKGGDLFSYISDNLKIINKKPIIKISISNIKKIVKWLLRTIFKCHQYDICHSDLKLDNIMLAEKNDLNSLKLIDFGSARFIHDHGKNIIYNYLCTSPHYSPPEVINKFHMPLKCDYLKNYDLVGENLFKIDMWQIGIITFILLHGYFPFDTHERDPIKKNKDIFKKIEFNKYPEFTQNKDIENKKLCDKNCEDFLKKTMCFDPNKRISIFEALMHPWLQ